MIFMPKHETILLYTEEKGGFVETALTQMRGTYGTHYFWRLWSVEGPGVSGGLFGYRLYPDNARPVVMEITVLSKFVHGSSNPTLGTVGDRTHPVILFTQDAVQFEGMWLENEPTDPALVQNLLRQLKPQ